RILVAGGSGSGKTTLARAIERHLGIPHTELDALHHGPGWSVAPDFEERVRALCAQAEWVCEWQYGAVRPLLAAHAEAVVWLDLPRRTVMRQVIIRTVDRRLHRRVLWNGNREPPLWTILRHRDHIIRWAWRTHGKSADRIAQLRRTRPDLPIVRLRSQREVAAWQATPGEPPPGGATW
ncbi:MAG: AAA family ATPase, partial [Nostocoides sp.]